MELNFKKALITGGAGFIGSHIVDAYLHDGHDVTVVDNLSSGFEKNVPKGANFIQTDVNSDEMDDVFRYGEFDLVNHHAAQISVRDSVENPIADAENNILATIRILNLSVTHGVKHVIYISSGGALYGEQDYFPADEKHIQKPASPYGITKMTGEHYCRFFSKTYGLKTTRLRYANVYGPLQSPHGEAGVVAIFATKMLLKEAAYINGTGEQTRDYVYISDIVEANRLAIKKDVTGSYNIGTGSETSVNQIFDLVKKYSNSNQDPHHHDAKKGEQLRSVLSSSLFTQATGWKPTVDIEKGVELTVDFFRGDLLHD